MEENLTEEAENEASAHPLMANFGEWSAKRCARQTDTTCQAVQEAYLAGDVELLETYDRLLGPKDGAWIRHLVKTVRKNPDLGPVQNVTEKQLLAFAEMRRATHAVVYAKRKSSNTDYKPDWDQVNALNVFAVSYPEHVAAVVSVMNEINTLDLECVNGLITERNNSHNALTQGVL